MSSEAERTVDLYRRHAHTWAKDRATQLVEGIWLDRFCNLQQAGTSVLDIGCGSGEPVARYLIKLGCTVTGVDSAPEMISLFKDNFPDLESHVADMRTLSLGRTFNGLLAWNSVSFTCPMMTRGGCSRSFANMPLPAPHLCSQAAPRMGKQSELS